MDKKNEKQERRSDDTPIYLTSDSTLQTPAEHQHDQSVDPRKDDTISVSNDDLRETETDRLRSEMTDVTGNDAATDSAD